MTEARKKIVVVVPSFNEAENIVPMYEALQAVFAGMLSYTWGILFIDNDSTDGTIELLRGLAARDPAVRVILNARNFGHIRSPYHGMLQADGDAVIALVADFQDPPELIPQMVREWEAGNRIVLAVRVSTQNSPVMEVIRTWYYNLVESISDVTVIKNFNGYGMYDRSVVEIVRQFDDPYPYYRGILSEVGFHPVIVPYRQSSRARGITKNNFFTLFDFAMNGITSLSRLPLRMITLIGFGLSLISILIALVYMLYKLTNWDTFQAGLAPLVVGQFFFNGVILFVLGLLGEYVGFIHLRTMKRPLVVERERLNFDQKSGNRNGTNHDSGT